MHRHGPLFSGNKFVRNATFVALAVMPVALSGCKGHGAQASTQASSGTDAGRSSDSPYTDIAITSKALQTGVKRFGMNLGGQNFYDSGQMMKNLVFLNPGFEGETWQSILRCEGVSATTCTDPNQWNQWPEDFLKGAQFQVLSGAATGQTGTVLSSSKADEHQKDEGVTIRFAPMSRTPELDDFVLVKQTIPGHAEAGWWTYAWGGGSFATETKDLAPNTPGKQALRLTALATGQSASVTSYFDSMSGYSFIQLKGPYRLTFRAKGLLGNRELHVNLNRAEKGGGNAPIFSKTVTLSNGWHDYSFDFTANENGHNVGTVGLGFSVGGGEILLDDVSLEHVSPAKENPTAFRDEVVETLRALQPGILRYQDGDHIGSTIDNLIAPPFARVRNGFSEGGSEQKQIPMGLQEFLQLCQVIHAEPWFNMPAGISPDDTRKLVEYLAGPATSPYGAKRAARGQSAPWTSVFPVIHLELGNEEWNAVTFAGAAMNDPVVYGQQAKMIFTTARSSPFYDPKKFDLVIGSFALIPDMTRKELAASGGYDTTAVAPYTFNRFDDDSSDEAIFGPMMAQPEMLDSRSGSYMAEQLKAARSAAHPATLSVYEENIGTSAGSVKQASFDRTVPSMGAGLALIDHMLLQLRDLGIKDQMVWSLAGFVNGFENSADHSPERTPLYGVVVDMGGPTNLRRPQYLAEKLANEALLPTMLETQLSGANPTWDQPKSANEDIQLDHAHYLQSFAFTDGAQRSLVVLNLSRSQALPVTFSGDSAPVGNVVVSRLTAKNISDTNEHQDNVHIVKETVASFNGHAPYSLPPFSMTVFQWTAGK